MYCTADCRKTEEKIYWRAASDFAHPFIFILVGDMNIGHVLQLPIDVTGHRK
jgi:hypothetical protein